MDGNVVHQQRSKEAFLARSKRIKLPSFLALTQLVTLSIFSLFQRMTALKQCKSAEKSFILLAGNTIYTREEGE